MTTYGLVANEGKTQVPLKSIAVNCSIQGFTANVTTELLYKNEDKCPVEASFVFPIDDSSAVYRFEAFIEGRLIVGECQTKEEARQTYQDAVSAGETAFLMEEDDSKGDVFECKVGNLPAKTEAKVTFSYVTQCPVTEGQGGTTSFTYPCVLGPRYSISAPDAADGGNSPSTSGGHTAQGRGQKVPTYVNVKDLPYTFSAEVLYYFKLPNKVRKVKVNMPGQIVTSRTSTYSKTLITKCALDRDLEVEILCTEQFKPMLYLEQGNPLKGGMLQHDLAVLQFHPKITDYTKEPSTKGEYIFVIDRSGSMGGDRITHAKKALAVCLDQLPADCYFNIVSFGSAHKAMFNKSKKMNIKGLSVKFSETHKKMAKNQVAQMDADLGGTEMIKPFEWIYKSTVISGYPRQIILLTDGAIWGDESAFFNMVKTENKTTRVFTFGIGFGASTSLVRGLARAGRGKCDFIKEDMHKMKTQVAHLLKCAMSPSVDDLQLDLKVPAGLSCSLIPTETPAIFMGDHFITYALLNGSLKKLARGKKSLLSATLSGSAEGQKVEFSIEADLSDILQQTIEYDHLPLHRLAAKAQIKELQDNETYNGQEKSKIELVSIAANIMSRYTSFVGVDKTRAVKEKQKPKHVDIPIASLNSRMAVAPAMAPPMAGGAPRLYGGAGPDASLALKYLCGKHPELPTDAKDKTPALTTTTTTTAPTPVPSQTDQTTEMTSESDKSGGQSSEVSGKQTEKNTDISEQKSVVQKRKRKSAGNKRLTVKKRRMAVKVMQTKFARWIDGYYYYATEVKSKEHIRAHCQVRFRDGRSCTLLRREVLSAVTLCPGDEVSVHCNRETYKWAMVLEYTSPTDRFTLAYADGTVFNCRTEHIVIPEVTAQRMKDRTGHQPEPKRLLTFLGSDGLLREVTTSDLAELNKKGWINETLVAFWISKVLPAKTSRELLAACHVISPRFFPTLTDCLELDEDFLELPGDTQSVVIERRWRSFVLRSDRWRASKTEEADRLVEGADLTHKQVLIFPMYDDLHWYVIVVNIQKDVLDQNIFRAQFSTMDSFYKCQREHETEVLKRYLDGYFSSRGLRLKVDPGVYQYQVPIQGQRNEWDCGTCTLQCIHNTFQDGLKPKANLLWFDRDDLAEQRKESARCILDEWEAQRSK